MEIEFLIGTSLQSDPIQWTSSARTAMPTSGRPWRPEPRPGPTWSQSSCVSSCEWKLLRFYCRWTRRSSAVLMLDNLFTDKNTLLSRPLVIIDTRFILFPRPQVLALRLRPILYGLVSKSQPLLSQLQSLPGNLRLVIYAWWVSMITREWFEPLRRN